MSVVIERKKRKRKSEILFDLEFYCQLFQTLLTILNHFQSNMKEKKVVLRCISSI